MALMASNEIRMEASWIKYEPRVQHHTLHMYKRDLIMDATDRQRREVTATRPLEARLITSRIHAVWFILVYHS